MAQVVGRDGTRLLMFTRSWAPKLEHPLVHYGRILDLATMTVGPELHLDSIVAHTGPWEPLNTPIPADRLLASARVQPPKP